MLSKILVLFILFFFEFSSSVNPPWPLAFNLASLDGDNGFQLTGSTNSFGQIVASGDLNGDNKDDIVVAIPDGGASSNGILAVFFGTSTAGPPQNTYTTPFNVASLNGTNGFTIVGEASDSLGSNTDIILCDVDNDGSDDLIFGNPAKGNGTVYLIWGSATWNSVFDITEINVTNGFQIDGLNSGDLLGASIAAGFFDAGGNCDIAIGAPGFNSNEGTVYVLFGNTPGSFAYPFNLSTLDGTTGFAVDNPLSSTGKFGSVLTMSGDFNNDLKSDLAISAPEGAYNAATASGEVYLLFGQATPVSNPYNISSLADGDGSAGFVFAHSVDNTQLGSGSLFIGNIDNSNGDDLVIGSPAFSSNKGSVIVLYGNNIALDPVFDESYLNSTNSVQITTTDVSANLGQSAYVGDINSDGFGDLLLGRPNGAGTAYILYSNGSLTATYDLSAISDSSILSTFSGSASNQLSYSVAMGDFNGDTFQDIIIGMNSASTGSVYVIFGTACSPGEGLSGTCGTCVDGSYSPNGISCIFCPTGSFSSSPGASTCGICSTGTFADAVNSTSCTNCSAGTFNPDQGATSAGQCQNCAAGTYSNDTASTCTSCSPGQGSPIASSSCSDCWPGEYSNSTTLNVCTECPLGSFSSSPGASTCGICSTGTYSGAINSTSCTNCTAGTFNPDQGATNSTWCQNCAAGTYSNDTASTCTSCSPGQGSPIASSSCSDCWPGEYSNSTTLNVCTECPLGSFSSSPGASTCGLCSTGAYADAINSTSCTNCTAGTFNPDQGATNSTSCMNCSAGYQSSEKAPICLGCPDGQSSGPGSATGSCSDCWIGEYSSSASSHLCYPCDLGSFSNTVGSPSCSLCPSGTYSGTVNSTSCSDCTAGQYSDSGSSTCSTCKAGSFASSNATEECSKCPENYFASENGATSCKKCPSSKPLSLPGSTTCFACGSGTALNKETGKCDVLPEVLGPTITLAIVIAISSICVCAWTGVKQFDSNEYAKAPPGDSESIPSSAEQTSVEFDDADELKPM